MFLRACLTFLWLANLFPLVIASSELAEAAGSAHTHRSGEASNSAPHSPASEECTLKGKVLNSVTGEPIRNALVQVTLEKMHSVLTLADGSFRFEGLPAGEGTLVVRKPGYFSESDVRPLSAGVHRVMLAADAPPVILKLVPEGVIFGTIQDEFGEPVEGVAVRLFRHNLSTGRKKRERQAEVDTDELGHYRFAELLPGTYYLSAGKWFGAAEAAHGNSKALRAKGYPTELYPGVSDLSAATPIRIVPGKRMQIDLSVAEKPLYRLGGTVSGCAAAQEPVSFQIEDATSEVLNLEPQFNPQTGHFQFAAVPPGSFTVIASSTDASERSCFARKSIHIASDVSNLHLQLVAASTIRVVMHREFSHEQPDEIAQFVAAPASIVLVPQDGSSQEERRMTEANVDAVPSPPLMSIEDVEPGLYTAEIEPTQGGYIYSAKCGSIDLLREDLTIDADAPPQSIEVVVRDDGAALGGTLTSNGRKSSGAVLLVPARAPRLLTLLPADSNGSFQFSNLAPGNYSVVGLDHVDDIEYRDPDFLRKYLPMGQELPLSPGQSVTIQLELVHVGE